MPTVNFTTAGSDTFTWKDGESKADLECYGAGEGGDYGDAGSGGTGGRGGDYAEKLQISRSGATDSVQVGTGGAGGTSGSPDGVAGGDSYFRNAATVNAKGGGSAGSNVGDTTFTGGAGGTGDSDFGGGGGGGAGDAANGSAGGNASGDNGLGGAGGASGGGNGGDGGDPTDVGAEGQGIGGGGGGGGDGGNGGTAAFAGKVSVTTVAGNLAFSQQPTNANSGAVISPSITVLIRRTDAANATDTDATGNVTLTIASGGGIIGGTTTKAAVAGVATFNDITVTGSGAHTLQAAHADCTSATSGSFTITGTAPTNKGMLLLDVGG